MTRTQVVGIRAVDAAIRELRGSVQRRLVAKASRQTMKPFVKKVRIVAPRQDAAYKGRRKRGNLQKSLVMSKTKKYPSGAVWTGIGPNVKFTGTGLRGRKEVPWRYAHFTETGSKFQRAQHWMEKFTNRHRPAMQRGFGLNLGPLIEMEAAKLRLKHRHKG